MQPVGVCISLCLSSTPKSRVHENWAPAVLRFSPLSLFCFFYVESRVHKKSTNFGEKSISLSPFIFFDSFIMRQLFSLPSRRPSALPPSPQ